MAPLDVVGRGVDLIPDQKSRPIAATNLRQFRGRGAFAIGDLNGHLMPDRCATQVRCRDDDLIFLGRLEVQPFVDVDLASLRIHGEGTANRTQDLVVDDVVGVAADRLERRDRAEIGPVLFQGDAVDRCPPCGCIVARASKRAGFDGFDLGPRTEDVARSGGFVIRHASHPHLVFVVVGET